MASTLQNNYDGFELSLKEGYKRRAMADNAIISYRTKTRYLVEELLARVAEKDPKFAGYKVLLSGSTNEGLRVGDPLEIDYLIQYDLDVKEIDEDTVFQLSKLVSYVRLYPKQQDCQKFKVNPNLRDQRLFSEVLLFSFVNTVLDIVENHEYRKRSLYLECHLKKRIINSKYQMRLKGIGAALEFSLVENGDLINDPENRIDVVLSFRLPGFWPKCAAGWKQYEIHLDEKCYKAILNYGASVVCKGPNPKLHDNFDDTFRLSFSFAEAHIISYMTQAEKEAYKLLKTIRDVELTNFKLGGIVVLEEPLKKALPSI